MDDRELLHEFVSAGDERAFAELVRRHHGWIRSVVLREVRDPATADDATQTAFVELAHHAGRIRSASSLGGWLRATARRTALNIVRARRRRQRHEIAAAAIRAVDRASGGGGGVGGATVGPLLDAAIARLSPGDRQLLTLAFVEGRRPREVANLLKLSEAAARKRIQRAVGRLREQLGTGGALGAVFGAAALVEPATSGVGELLAKFSGLFKPALTKALAAAALVLIAGAIIAGGPGATVSGVASIVPASAPAPTAAPVAPPPIAPGQVLSRQQLLERVRALRGRVKDLSVSYTSRNAGEPVAGMVNLIHENLVVKGEKICVEIDLEMGAGPAQRRLSFDGKRSTLVHSVPGPGAVPRGMIQDGKAFGRELELKDRAFVEMNLLAPPETDPGAAASPGANFASLEGILASPQTRVSDRLEPIDAHPCHVIEGGRELRVWIDAERGCVPLKVEHLKARMPEPMITMKVDAVLEVEPGLWLATHGLRRTAAMPEAGLAKPLMMEVAVDGWDGEHPALSVNGGIDDDYFDLTRRLPKGSMVSDLDSKRGWIVGGAATSGAGGPQPRQTTRPAKP